MFRNSTTRGAAAGLFLAALAATGCSGKKSTVDGAVTIDAGRIETGSVTFVPTVGGDKAAKVSGRIIENKYQITKAQDMTPGSYRVEINWNKKTGRKIMSDGIMLDETVEGMPAKYNSQTELTAAVEPGSNTIDFDLKGK